MGVACEDILNVVVLHDHYAPERSLARPMKKLTRRESLHSHSHLFA
jgi:hypothetical protein